MVCVPLPAVGVYVTEQLPEASVQVVLLKVPVPLEPKVTVPVGVLVEPPLVSATVAVQVLLSSMATEAGRQFTVVVVVRSVTVRPKVPALPLCLRSPP